MTDVHAGLESASVVAGRVEASAHAHGRVNIIGEHTDYHQGFVLPTLLPQRTTVQLRLRADRLVRARSAVFDDGPHTYFVGEEAPGRGWLDYVQGVTAIAEQSGMVMPGFDLSIDSTVPVGAGVSSSAALEVALMRALRRALQLEIDDLEIARLCQRVETEFVGAPVGIMDQMACSLGREHEALFIDTRTLDVQHVTVPPDAALIVIDSGVAHQHAGGAYIVRRRESFEAAALLDVAWLRDIDIGELSRVEALPRPLDRRARHIITENHRVLDAVDALRGGRLEQVGTLLNASHASMRDDYDISTDDVDTLAALGAADPDVFGARMTGGGSGGAVMMLARKAGVRAAAERIHDAYARHTGRTGAVLMPLPA